MAGHLTYRSDIDGLRSIAILGVVIFHFFPRLLPGGFMGVDVFFVISGYLITAIIFSNLQAGTFSFLDFYQRRVRRIFPALCLVLAAVLIAGWLVFLPHEFLGTSRHAAASALFSANFIFWSELDYFDASKYQKPLLHLWSLGVEEQFYLLWPLIVAFAFRRTFKWLLPAIVALSFIGCAVLSIYDTEAAFYLPVTRFWELGIGGLLAISERRGKATPRRNGNLGVAGLLLIVISYAVPLPLDFPGVYALLPSAGAALVIAAGRDRFVNRPVLSNPVMVFIGLISYPLYLWHWPLLTFTMIVAPEQAASLAVKLLLIACAVLLAWLTWKFVERPLRQVKPAAAMPGLGLAMTAILVIGAAGSAVVVLPRLADDRLAQMASAAALDKQAVPEGLSSESISGGRLVKVPGSGGGAPVLFMGDSTMAQYLPRLAFVAENGAVMSPAVFFTRGGCPPIDGVMKAKEPKCRRFAERAARMAREEDFGGVVISARWEQLEGRSHEVQLEGAWRPLNDVAAQAEAWRLLEEQVAGLVRQKKSVVLMLPFPTGSAYMNPVRLIAPCQRLGTCARGPDTPDAFPRGEAERATAHLSAILRGIAARTGAATLDPIAMLCNGSQCPLYASDGSIVYRDETHVSASYARNFAGFMDRLAAPEK